MARRLAGNPVTLASRPAVSIRAAVARGTLLETPTTKTGFREQL